MIRLILFASLCWPLVAHSEVYKWVDSEGNVHFTDKKPEDGENVQTVDTSATRLSESQQQAAQRRTELLKESTEITRAAQSEYDQRLKLQRAQNKQNQAKRAAACQRAQHYLDVTQHSNRVYTTDQQGNRTYKSDDERVATAKAARNMVAEHCD